MKNLTVKVTILLLAMFSGGHLAFAKSSTYFKNVSGDKTISLDPTNGKENLANAKDVFYFTIGDNIDFPSKKTGRMEIEVFEEIKTGTFQQFFESFGENLDRLCLTQAQIKQFCKKRAEWVNRDKYSTLFLFKVKKNYFVANVVKNSSGLELVIMRPSDTMNGYVTRNQLVLPK